MQRTMVIPYRLLGYPVGPIVKGPLNMVPIGSPETSVRNYQFTLRNIPEERRPHLHRCGNLKLHSHIVIISHIAHTRNIALSCKILLSKNPPTRNTDALDSLCHSAHPDEQKISCLVRDPMFITVSTTASYWLLI
jgi:hypothetical protein